MSAVCEPPPRERDFPMRRSLQASYEESATRFPTYVEHHQPIAYDRLFDNQEEPFTGIDLISFRRRWSEPGRLMTQWDLAQLFGMAQRQIVRYERNESKISRLFLMALSYLEIRLCQARGAQVSNKD